MSRAQGLGRGQARACSGQHHCPDPRLHQSSSCSTATESQRPSSTALQFAPFFHKLNSGQSVSGCLTGLLGRSGQRLGLDPVHAIQWMAQLEGHTGFTKDEGPQVGSNTVFELRFFLFEPVPYFTPASGHCHGPWFQVGCPEEHLPCTSLP